MEANPVRIVQYFDGEKQSIIPLFQRPYTWTRRNWQTLWDDIMVFYDDIDISSSHFMGAVVSIPAKTMPVGVTKHLIIDGQQRLTTVSLLLCALRDTLDERKSAQIQDYLVNRHYDNSSDFLKLLPTQGDRSEYLSIVKNNNDSTSNHSMRDCYNFFVKKITGKDEDGEKISVDKILEITKSHLQVVMINLGEADDPYLIFESLNFKGEALTQADLVRNYILMRFRHSLDDGGIQERIYNEIWRPIETLLGKNIESFLWHYAVMEKFDVKKPKTYTAIKEHFNKSKTEEDVELSLVKIFENAKYYEKFIIPSKETNPLIQQELYWLFRFEATISYPLLLRLFSSLEEESIDENTVIKSLRVINSFILRRAVCLEKRSALNKLFIRLTSRFPDIEQIDEWLISELSKPVRSERWPDDVEFKNAIISNHLYGQKPARILLESIEAYLAGKEVVDLGSEKITIEHIMPQTLTDEWKNELGEEYENVHRTYLDTMGNLTLTAYNSELSNLMFSKKMDNYSNSGIALNRDLSQFERWGEKQIIKRGEYLANIAIKVWPRASL